ncbi:NUDIX domain-containing protein [Flexivirga lutea]
MSHWSSSDDRVMALPSGRLIRGRGLSAHPELSPDPEFGLYLLATPVSGVPWEHTWVEWTDFGLPIDPMAARRALAAAWQRAARERVEIACLGGLGRTGTALACLAVLDGLPADTAITLVRTRYDARAIETAEQVDYVTEFAEQSSGTRPASDARAVRVGAYAVCVRDGYILLTHQLSPGPAQGKWTLPGGGVDFGEDPADAAFRECREETGLTPTIGRPLGVHSSTVDAFGELWHSVRLLYAASFPDGRPEPTSPQDGEIDRVGWFPTDRLPEPVTDWVTLAVRSVA